MHERIAKEEAECDSEIFKKFGKNVDFEVSELGGWKPKLFFFFEA